MSKSNYFIFIAWIMLVITGSLKAEDLPSSFPAPPNAQLSIVSDNAKTLGMNLNIRKFITNKKPAEIVRFYQRKWKDQAATTLLAPWTMVGTRVKNKFYNVQVQADGGGSWGYLSVSDLPGKIDEQIENKKSGGLETLTKNEFAAMGNTRVLDAQQHSDLLNYSSTSSMTNRFSIDANRTFYLHHYKAKGWNLKQDSENALLKSRVLLFNKGNRSLSFTINRIAGETQIVANMIAAKRLGGL